MESPISPTTPASTIGPTSHPLGGPGGSTSSDGSDTPHSYPITPCASDDPPPPGPLLGRHTKRYSTSYSMKPKLPRMGSMASLVHALSKRSSKASLNANGSSNSTHHHHHQYAPLPSPESDRKGLPPLSGPLAQHSQGLSSKLEERHARRGSEMSGMETFRGTRESSWKGNFSRTMKRISISSRWSTRSISVDQGPTNPPPGWYPPTSTTSSRISGDSSFPVVRGYGSLDAGRSSPKSGTSSLHVAYPPSPIPSTYDRPLSAISTHSSAAEDLSTRGIVSPSISVSTTPKPASSISNQSIAQPLLPPSTSDESVLSHRSTRSAQSGQSASGESTYYDAPTDQTSDLSFDVFSPRVPEAPVIRRMQGTFSPISELELPTGEQPMKLLTVPPPLLPRPVHTSPAILLPASRLPQLQIEVPAALHTDTDTKRPMIDEDARGDTAGLGTQSRRPSEVILTPPEEEVPSLAHPTPATQPIPASLSPSKEVATSESFSEGQQSVDTSCATQVQPSREVKGAHALASARVDPVILESSLPSHPVSLASTKVPTPQLAPASSFSSTGRTIPSPRRTSAFGSSTATIAPRSPPTVYAIGRSGSVTSFNSSMIRSPLTGLPSPALPSGGIPSGTSSVGFQWNQGTILPYIPGLVPATLSARPAIYATPIPPSLIASPKTLVHPIREPAPLPKPPGWESRASQSSLEKALSRRRSGRSSGFASPAGSHVDLTGLGLRASTTESKATKAAPEKKQDEPKQSATPSKAK